MFVNKLFPYLTYAYLKKYKKSRDYKRLLFCRNR